MRVHHEISESDSEFSCVGHANLGKRQVKSPKVYIRDSGLLHTLPDIRDRRDLERHPKVGASWAGYALHQITRRLGALPQECQFWSVHSGAEIDLLWVRGRRRWGTYVGMAGVGQLGAGRSAGLRVCA